MRPFGIQVVVELHRLRSRRSVWVLTVLALLVSALMCTVYAVLANSLASEGHAFDARELVTSVVAQGSMAPLFTGVIAAMAVASDLRYGVLTRSVLGNPDRKRVLAAMLVAVTTLAIGLATSCWIIGAGLTYVTAGGSTLAPPSVLALGDGLLSHCLFTAAWALITSSLAVLIRAQVPVIVLSVVFPLFIESTVRGIGQMTSSGVLAWVSALTPGGAGAAVQRRLAAGPDFAHLVSAGAVDLSPLQALGVLLVTVTGLVSVGMRSFAQRPLV